MLRLEAKHPFSGGGVCPIVNLKNRHADLTLHINELLNPDRLKVLKDRLSHLKGLIKVEFSDDHPHLAVIVYDPLFLNTNKILKVFQERESLSPISAMYEPEMLHVRAIGM